MPVRRTLLAAALGGAAGAPWEGEAWPSLDSIANARRLYRTGETGVPECWLATTLLDDCPDEWPAPEYTMAHDEGEYWYPAETHTLTYKMEAPSVNVLDGANGDGVYHANIHACPVGVGLCQPYMDPTVTGLITQTSVVSGAFGEVFSQDIQLPDVGVWVLIAHFRFDVGDDDDDRTRADAARAIYVTVEDTSICPPGTYKLNYVCEPCEPGTYSDQNNSAACLPCLYGAAAPASGATACDDCAAGKFAAVRGATSSNTSGVATAADWCKPCAAGYASASAASVLCEPCESGATSEAGSPTCDLCTAGYLRRYDGFDCERCDGLSGFDASRCYAGTTLATAPVKAGFWRSSPRSDAAFKCPRGKAACPGGSMVNASLCADGYVGVACASCGNGFYYSAAALVCRECDGDGGRATALAVYTILGVGCGFVLGWLAFSKRGQSLFQLFAITQGGAASDIVAAVRVQDEMTETDLGAFGKKAVKWITKAKAVFSFYQLIAALPVALGDIRYPATYRKVLLFANFFSLSFVGLVPSSCVLDVSPQELYLRNLVSTTMLPVAMTLCLYVGYRVNVRLHQADAKDAGSYFTMFLLLVHFVLPFCAFEAFRSVLWP